MIHSISSNVGDVVALKHQKLQHAAEQFEGMMMQEILKPLQHSEEESSTGGDTMKAYATEALAGAFARQGSLGFGAKIVRSVEMRENNSLRASSPAESRR